MSPRKAAFVAFFATCFVMIEVGILFGGASIEPGKLFGETIGRYAFTTAGVVYLITWLFNNASRGE